MRLRRAGWVFATALVVSNAGAESARPAVIWYRSSEGCPTGSEFVYMLGDRSSAARLAEAGDRVDFVVTLSADEQGSVGRLERQTNAGIIAVSEVEDTDCGRVAEALALSLALSLVPETGESAPTESEESSSAFPQVRGLRGRLQTCELPES